VETVRCAPRWRPRCGDVEEPRIIQLPNGLEVLVYDGPAGLRVDSWKSLRVEAGALIERQLEEPSDTLRARSFEPWRSSRRTTAGSRWPGLEQ
jgi:hypothetical protein